MAIITQKRTLDTGGKTIEFINNSRGARPEALVVNDFGAAVLLSASTDIFSVGYDDARDVAAGLVELVALRGLDVAAIGDRALAYLALEDAYRAADLALPTSIKLKKEIFREKLVEQGKSYAQIEAELSEYLAQEAESSEANEAILKELRLRLTNFGTNIHISLAVEALRAASEPQVPPTAEQVNGQILITTGSRPYLMSHEQLHSFAAALRTAADSKTSVWRRL